LTGHSIVQADQGGVVVTIALKMVVLKCGLSVVICIEVPHVWPWKTCCTYSRITGRLIIRASACPSKPRVLTTTLYHRTKVVVVKCRRQIVSGFERATVYAIYHDWTDRSPTLPEVLECSPVHYLS
jgi:hypothetical protein